MPTKTIDDFTNTPNILDGDFFAFWNLASSRTDKISYLNLKADILGTASNTEILFMDGANIAGDSRITYNNSTNVFSLQASMVGATVDDFTNTVHADGIHKQIRNESGAGLVKGDLVHASGFSIGQDLVLVKKADATSTATMPVMGVVTETIANNATGGAIESGRISGVDTSSFSVGDLLFATTTPGVFGARPTNSTDIVQSIGVVLRSHASLGEIEVEGAGSINTPPNLLDAAMWIGNASNFPVPRVISGDITISNTGVASVSSGTFLSGQLQLNNPADTFQYIFTGSAIIADRAVTLPLLAAPDTFVMEAATQTLSNKTFSSDVDMSANDILDVNILNLSSTPNQVYLTEGTTNEIHLFLAGAKTWEFNVDFIDPVTDNTRNLGSASRRFNTMSVQQFRAGQSAGQFTRIQGRDIDGAAWLTFLTVTSGNTPALVIESPAGGTTTITADALTVNNSFNIVDTADTTFDTSKLLTRDAGGVVNTIAASGGAATDYLDGSGSWSVPAGNVSVTNQADNRIVTATAVGDTLNAEASLTYDGTSLFNSSNGTAADPSLKIGADADGFFRNGVSQIGVSLNNALVVIFGILVSTFGSAIKTPTGTASDPGLRVGQDDDGLYRSNANEISFSMNNVQTVKFTTSGITMNVLDIVTDTTTGMKLWTAAAQKGAFWGLTPVVQPLHIIDADGTLADITTKFNTLLAQMASTGLQAAT